MPDTPRTVSELKTIFADNASHDISAQDMRDLVESLANPVDQALASKLGSYAAPNYSCNGTGTTLDGDPLLTFVTPSSWSVPSGAEDWFDDTTGSITAPGLYGMQLVVTGSTLTGSGYLMLGSPWNADPWFPFASLSNTPFSVTDVQALGENDLPFPMGYPIKFSEAPASGTVNVSIGVYRLAY